MKLLSRTLGTALAIAALCTAYGAAATLGFASNPLSAGNTSVNSCGVSSLSATRQVDNSGNVTQVTVGSVPSTCAGATLVVTLVGAGGTGLSGATTTVPAGGGTISLSSFGATVTAANVVAYSFAVTGP
jgi:hypothetical protein